VDLKHKTLRNVMKAINYVQMSSELTDVDYVLV
jgi:hypothetical protein